ncbi:peptide deformylase [Synergistales bacterium]|nr:peptide deformylase [Synergistales bacterium]
MSVREVLVFPNPALRQKAERVTEFDDKLRRLVFDMWETMYISKGVGLAAPQIGVPLRVIVIDWEGSKRLLVNPELLESSGEIRDEEGCLSFPGIFEDVTRPERIRVAYQDENGERTEEAVEGFFARVFLHEMDHLDAKLLIDRVSAVKRAFLKKKLERKAK